MFFSTAEPGAASRQAAVEPLRDLCVGQLFIEVEDQDVPSLWLQLGREEAGEREMIPILHTDLRHIIEGEMPAHQLTSGSIVDTPQEHLEEPDVRPLHLADSILVQQ